MVDLERKVMHPFSSVRFPRPKLTLEVGGRILDTNCTVCGDLNTVWLPRGEASFQSLEMTFIERRVGEDREKGVGMRAKRGNTDEPFQRTSFRPSLPANPQKRGKS